MIAENNAPTRGLTYVLGAIAVAALAAGLTLHAREFTIDQWVVTAFASIGICIAAMHALPIRGLRMRRSGLTAEAVFMDLSIGAPMFAIGGNVGPVAAALAFALGFSAAALLRRNNAITDLTRHGALRVLACMALLPFVGNLTILQTLPPYQGSLVFLVGISIVALVFLLGLSAATSAFSFQISLPRVWERQVRDPRTWIVGVGNVIWATAVRDPMLDGHYYIAVAMWMPVCVTALLLRTIDEQHAELHRLRLVRDAVQAMLGDRDPLPQINAILATLRVPSYDETVSVVAATSTRTENWRTVTTLGPQLSSAGDELRRRILARMKFSGQPYTTLRDDYYVSYAFAARLADGELHGAMIVHRRNDRPLSNDQVHSFTNAAFELAPLLRDMRAIAATQSAATIDQLTGLFNRATTLDRLASVLEEMTLAEHGAVLLLDIDHFKTINDQLGHAAGDDCLRKIGEIMRNAVRGGDTAGRIGGEEFLVIMPGATRDVAMGVAERLRLAVALGGMRYASGEPVTTSIGAAVMQIGDTVESLLARADRGLYEAKRQGRNRIVEDQETA